MTEDEVCPVRSISDAKDILVWKVESGIRTLVSVVLLDLVPLTPFQPPVNVKRDILGFEGRSFRDTTKT